MRKVMFFLRKREITKGQKSWKEKDQALLKNDLFQKDGTWNQQKDNNQKIKQKWNELGVCVA